MNSHRSVFFAAMTLGTVLAGTATADAATLKFACGSGPQMEHCKKTAQAWAEQHGHTVELISTPPLRL